MASSEIFFQISNFILEPVRNEAVFILCKVRNSFAKTGCRIGSETLSAPIFWYIGESLLVATQNISSKPNFTNICTIPLPNPINKSDPCNSGRKAILEISQHLFLKIPKLSQLPKYCSKGNSAPSCLQMFTRIV